MSSSVQNPDLKLAELVPVAQVVSEKELLDRMPWLPCTLSVDVPIVRFTIGNLLSLANGSIVETACHQTSDVPLRINELLVGWAEFEVIGDRLAVRITDQA